jgi:hypothetical protein
MKEFKGKLYLGVGSLLIIKAQLDSVKDQYDAIYVSPYYDLLRMYRSNCEQEYINFVGEFFKLLFSEPPYIITDDQSYPPMDNFQVSDLGIKPVKPNLASLLCDTDDSYIPKEPYFVLTTKVREYSRDYFDAVAVPLLNGLDALPLTPVILGEREVGMNEEYKLYGDKNIYSLYDFYMHNLNCIDMTIEEKGLSAPNLASLKRDCNIMNKAKFTFTVGIGGPLVIAMSVGNIIGWAGDISSITQSIMLDKPEGLFLTTDLAHMLLKLEKERQSAGKRGT